MQAMNQMVTDRSGMLAGEVEPVANGVKFTVLNAADCAQAGTFDHHRHNINKEVPI